MKTNLKLFAVLFLTIFLMASVSAWADNLNSNLTAYYKLNESAGTNVFDSFSGLLNGTSSGIVFDNNGIIENMYNFSNSDNSNIDTTLIQGLGADFSLSFWLKLADYNSGQIWAFSNATSEPDMFVRTTGTEVRFRGNEAGNLWDWSILIPLDTWTHIVLTKTSDSGGTTNLYIDGVLNQTASPTNFPSGAWDTILHKWGKSVDYVGGSILPSSDFSLDEVAYFNKELNSTEVEQLYNSGSALVFNGLNETAPIIFTPNLNITNCTDLQNILFDLTEDYVLINDIDCSDTINWNEGSGFIPLGNYSDYFGNDNFSNTFSGSIEGQGYKISNLFINHSATSETFAVGLIGLCAYCSISNVNMENATIITEPSGSEGASGLIAWGIEGTNNQIINSSVTGYLEGHHSIGALIGEMWSSTLTIENSYANVNVSASSGSGVGGLVGSLSGTTGNIINSFATGNIIGGDSVGGLVGYTGGLEIVNSSFQGIVQGTSNIGGLTGFNYANISNSFATGIVTGSNADVGGLVGEHNSNITNSYAIVNVSGDDSVGGLVGYSEGNIDKSYSAGLVTGNTNTGGLLGNNVSGLCSASYWDTQTSGQGSSGCGTGEISENMVQQATFSDWDFTNVWGINESITYPYLRFNPVLFAPTIIPIVIPSVTGTPIYQILNSSGSGLALFLQYLARALPIILIILAIVSAIVGIIYGLVQLIKLGIKGK